jgi:hypothetical protein
MTGNTENAFGKTCRKFLLPTGALILLYDFTDPGYPGRYYTAVSIDWDGSAGANQPGVEQIGALFNHEPQTATHLSYLFSTMPPQTGDLRIMDNLSQYASMRDAIYK